MGANKPSKTAPATTLFEEAAGGAVALLKSGRKHWTMLLASVLLAGGASLLFAKSQPRVYEATSMIEINPHPTQPLGEKANGVTEIGASLFSDPREYYETQYKLVTSDRVLNAVVRDSALTADYAFFGYKSPPASPISIETASAVLRGKISVESVKRSRLALIKVEDLDPKRAQRLADAVVKAFIQQNLEVATNSSVESFDWLNGQLDSVRSALEETENALHTFKEKNELPSTSINEASNMVRVEMEEYNRRLANTRSKKQELAARHAELSKVSDTNPDDLPASELLANTFLQKLRGEYQDAVKLRLELLAQGKGENHPLVKGVDEKIAETKAALLNEVHNIKGAVQHDLAEVERTEAGEAALFENARKRAVDLNMKEIEYHRLDRARSQNEKLYEFLLERQKEAGLARMMTANNIRCVDAARLPVAPIRPRVSMIVAVGIMLGILAGIALAWLRELLDSSLKTPDDVERFLNSTFLGLLPDLASDDRDGMTGRRRRRAQRTTLKSVELIVHERPLSGLAEAARAIRTNLMFMNPDTPYRRLLVSSAAPSEGKTTVACSIAIALAQGGQRVCIVDCDLRRPRLHRIFGRAGDQGVTNVMVGEATIDEIAKPTEVPNLWSIPAGPTPPNPADLLQSERFRRFLDDVSARFDRVIIDSPPVVAVTDAAVISRVVDGTVFVTRAFKTNKHLARQGLRSLVDVDAPMAGVVLNAVNLNRHEYSYYYHYYYYKRDGYAPRAVAARASDDDDRPSAAAAN